MDTAKPRKVGDTSLWVSHDSFLEWFNFAKITREGCEGLKQGNVVAFKEASWRTLSRFWAPSCTTWIVWQTLTPWSVKKVSCRREQRMLLFITSWHRQSVRIGSEHKITESPGQWCHQQQRQVLTVLRGIPSRWFKSILFNAAYC